MHFQDNTINSFGCVRRKQIEEMCSFVFIALYNFNKHLSFPIVSGRKHSSYHELTLNRVVQVRTVWTHQLHGVLLVLSFFFRLFCNFYSLSRLPSIHGISPIVHIYLQSERVQVGTTPEQHYIVAPLRLFALPSAEPASHVAAFMGGAYRRSGQSLWPAGA